MRRVKATLLKKDTTSQREEYHRLPAYIDELQEANPGTHLKLNLDPDTGAFLSMFICPQTSREASRHCRKIVAMDGTFTKNSVQQCILIAVTVDADNHAVRLAWGIVESESEARFLSDIKTAIPEINFTFILRFPRYPLIHPRGMSRFLVRPVSHRPPHPRQLQETNKPPLPPGIG
jgi:hypothetical protein